MRIDRIGISLMLLAVAAASFVSVRSAIAGKMIFLAGTVVESIEVGTSFHPENGTLTLDPKGTHEGALKIEVVAATTGRSPAAQGSSSTVMKRVFLTKTTSIQVGTLVPKHGTIQIRVLAP
jgi:hypothetical protein